LLWILSLTQLILLSGITRKRSDTPHYLKIQILADIENKNIINGIKNVSKIARAWLIVSRLLRFLRTEEHIGKGSL
jgi:hypothetical protein